MVDCCFNCGAPCYAPYLGRITTFHIKSANGVEDNVAINIAVALSVVFEGALKYSKVQIPTNEGGPPEASIGLCVNCAPALINLYSYYTKFMGLSTATSSLAKAIRNCRLWNFSCEEEENDDDVCQPPGGGFEDYHHHHVENDDNDSDIEILDVKIKEEPGEINFDDRHEEPSSTHSQPPKSHIKNNDGRSDVGRKRVVIKLERLNQSSAVSVDSTQPQHFSASVNSTKTRPRAKKQLTKRNLARQTELQRRRRAAQRKIAEASMLKCSYCPKYCKNQEKLDSHIKYRHHSIGLKLKHSCTICSKSFHKRQGLTQHQNLVHAILHPKTSTCPICQKELGRNNLKTHIQFVHGTDNYTPPSCQYCEKSYRTPKSLMDHLALKHKEELLAANPDSENLVVYPDEDTRYSNYCRICKLRCDSKLGYLQHKVKFHPDGGFKFKRYSCSQCVRVFREKPQLRAHESFIHGKTAEETEERMAGRTCGVCGVKFAYPSLLKTHQTKATCKPPTESASAKTCLLCNEEFETHLHLHNHKINIHRSNSSAEGPTTTDKTIIRCRPATTSINNSPLVCQFCNKSFNVTTTLTKHIRAVHDSAYKKDKPKPIGEIYTCEFCGVSIKWSTNFAKHMKMKHGSNNKNGKFIHPPSPIICHGCGKSFSDRGRLQQHLRSNAHGDKGRKYQCGICSRLYAVETNYLNHLKLHSTSSSTTTTAMSSSSSLGSSSSVSGPDGLKPLSLPVTCPECGKIFASKFNLQKHLFTVHGVGVGVYAKFSAPTPYECSHCGRSFKIKESLVQHLKTKQHGGPGLDVGRRPRTKNPKRIVLEINELSS